MDPKSPPPDVAVGIFGCAGPILAIVWFITRLLTLTTARADKSSRQDTLKVPRHYPLLERATLIRIATPTTKKKYKNDVASSEAAYAIQGHGTQATDPVDLDAGLYRLAYRFKPDVPMTVKLTHCLNGEEDVLLKNIAGTGSRTFTVTDADRYLFQVVAPGAQFPTWKIEVERL